MAIKGYSASPPNSRITITSLSNCLVSYKGHSLRESYFSAEIQSVHPAAPADCAKYFRTSVDIVESVRETMLCVMRFMYSINILNGSVHRKQSTSYFILQSITMTNIQKRSFTIFWNKKRITKYRLIKITYIEKSKKGFYYLQLFSINEKSPRVHSPDILRPQSKISGRTLADWLLNPWGIFFVVQIIRGLQWEESVVLQSSQVSKESKFFDPLENLTHIWKYVEINTLLSLT